MISRAEGLHEVVARQSDATKINLAKLNNRVGKTNMVLKNLKTPNNGNRTLLDSLQQENGQSLVEFAVVIGLLLIFTFAMVDFSRFVYVASTIHAAAQEGARYGIGELGYGNEVDPDSVQDIVRSKVMGLNPDQVNVTVSAPDPDTV